MSNETMKDGERASFEAAWATQYPDHGKCAFVRSRIDPDRYATTRVQDGWLMWQAHAASPQSVSPLGWVWEQEPVAEWQTRYMGDPRQPGCWQRTLDKEWARAEYEKYGGETNEKGWQVRPLYARPVEPQAAHPPLVGGLVHVPCSVQLNLADRFPGWLFVPHVDNEWVSAVKLDDFSLKVIETWLKANRSKP